MIELKEELLDQVSGGEMTGYDDGEDYVWVLDAAGIPIRKQRNPG
jgi:hypothetical protein